MYIQPSYQPARKETEIQVRGEKAAGYEPYGEKQKQGQASKRNKKKLLNEILSQEMNFFKTSELRNNETDRKELMVSFESA